MLMECGYEKCAEAKIVDEFTYDYKKNTRNCLNVWNAMALCSCVKKINK